jgi:hypothetical protein
MSTYLVILIGIADAISEKWIEFAPDVLTGSTAAYAVASARSKLC